MQKNNEISEILYRKLTTPHEVIKAAAEHSPVDLAYAASRLPLHLQPILYENLPNRDAKTKYLINTDSDTRAHLFSKLQDRELKKIFDKMPTDDAVWILEDMPKEGLDKVMVLIDPKKARNITDMQKHRRNSAGRLMNSDFFAFSMDRTLAEAAIHIRDNPGIDFGMGIFIVNDVMELQGVVPARNMIVNPPNTPLRQVMLPIFYKVGPEAAREEVVELVEKYKLSSLPVVDQSNHLVGVIAYEDMVDAMEDATDQQMAHIAGTAPGTSSYDPISKRFITRAPWLAFTLVAGLINGWVMSSFLKLEGKILTFVLFFVPLITAMSGNIGLQCSTVLVRGMALGMASSLRKELCSGLVIGSVFGVLCSLLIYFFGESIGATPLTGSIIVGTGLIGGCFAGTFLGVFSPFVFFKIGIDPAISSGPIVTALNDILSMTIYFLVAWGISNFFFS